MLQQLIPNVIEYSPELLKALKETLIMVSISGLFAALIGIPVGVILLVTSEGHILKNRMIYSIISKIVNSLRSIPFVILIAAIPGITRMLAGTTIGIKGAIVPLVIASFPFVARQIEVALLKVDMGVIEAYQAMGFSPFGIIFKVILVEGLKNIVLALTISLISLIGFSAITGTVGGGGLGDFAIRYGYQYFKTDIMVVTIIIILLIVYVIQGVGDFIYKKLSH
ncbi:MAG: transporter permease [Clostridiales bacterium]|jgi:D-methionine transport system permease protein|nr:transporter permease [Clostridiales bacterium]